MESTLRLFYLTFYLVEEGIFRGLDVRDAGGPLLLFLRREEGLQCDPVLRHGLDRSAINRYAHFTVICTETERLQTSAKQ